ncbi:MAG: hypothetical protein M0T84_00345 [Betaproteobacteria bacterium]|nr:hypothetical protein [Betaproteobacteria bacterium]
MTMRYFANPDDSNKIYGYDEVLQAARIDAAVAAKWAEVTASWPPSPTMAQQWAAYQAEARAALSDSDTTMHRIAEGVALGTTSWTAADVVQWANFRRSLRAILSQAQPTTIPTALPPKPPYPVGT